MRQEGRPSIEGLAANQIKNQNPGGHHGTSQQVAPHARQMLPVQNERDARIETADPIVRARVDRYAPAPADQNV